MYNIHPIFKNYYIMSKEEYDRLLFAEKVCLKFVKGVTIGIGCYYYNKWRITILLDSFK